jgi:hypothetical protein
MKTSLAVRLEELIENTSDKQFNRIYTDLKDYQKKHFIEFNLMKSISLMDDLVNTIEEQQIFRSKLKKKSMQVVHSVEEPEEEEEKIVVDNKKETSTEEPWETWWKQQPAASPKPLSFGKIFAYVVGAHICLIGYVSLYSMFKSPVKTTTVIETPVIEQQVVQQRVTSSKVPDMPKYVGGPKSDALIRR